MFGFFWFVVAFWTCFVAFQFQMLKWMAGHYWGWFLHLGCVYVPVVFFHFTLLFSGRKSEHSKALKWAYLTATFFILLNTFTDLFTVETVYRDAYTYPRPAVLYPLYIIFFQVMGIWSIFLLFQFRKGLTASLKKALDAFLVVFLLAYLGSMDNYLIMYDVQLFPLYPFGLYLIVPFAIVGSRSVLKLQKSAASHYPKK